MGGIMKIRRDIVIAGLVGLFLAVTAHGTKGQASVLDSTRPAAARPAVSARSPHHRSGHQAAVRAAVHPRHGHHRAT
jgi:hypothetical protein